MNVVMIIPTGVGCEIGGHDGDANPVAKLIASCCDNLILHPNVVNASDVNEMPENCLYVEGSILDKFLNEEIYLKKVNFNKVLVATNSPVRSDTINAISSARVTIGMNAEIVELKTPLRLIAKMEDGFPTGDVLGWKELVEQVKDYEFDALALATPIEIDGKVLSDYYKVGGINPIGKVEAIATRLIASALGKPAAHAPIMWDKETIDLQKFEEIVDPRVAPEIISVCFIHCLLKGLHKSPKIVYEKGYNTLGVDEVDCMIAPMGCFGEPHLACLSKNIPIIIVKENKTCLNDFDCNDGRFTFVENYVEAAGYLMSMKAGVDISSVRRPFPYTKVI